MSVNKIVLINKPSGVPSFRVTSAVRRKLNTKKAGHAGTLDPMASGVLAVYTGNAARFIDLSEDEDDNKKRYVAGFRLGQTTDTLDCEGQVLDERPVSVGEQDILKILPDFTGRITQIPPMFSAIKKDGVPLYKLARQGIKVDVKSREITVYSIKLLSFDGRDGVIDVVCSKGTYIRTLIADIGETLGCGAHMISLERTLSNGYTIDMCVSLDDFVNGDESCIHDADFAVMKYPRANVSSAQERLFRNGGGLFKERMKIKDDYYSKYYRVYSNDVFVGLGILSDDGTLINPKCIMT